MPVAHLGKDQLIPGKIRRRQLLLAGAGLSATTVALGGWLWFMAPRPPVAPQSRHAPIANSGDRFVVYWNNATLDALLSQQAPLPVAARALSIVNTCMFDAWAAYDAVALGTRLGAALRQPESERTLPNKCQAMSYAAYHALLNLFPGRQAYFQRMMNSMKYHPTNLTTDSHTPAGVGNLAARAVLSFRQNDGSNQSGASLPGAYADYTRYQPLNTPDELKHQNHWQPLTLPEGQINAKPQQFACAHWGNVMPFAITSALQFVPRPGPARYPEEQYTNQAIQVLQYSANLTEEQKAIAEYWAETSKNNVLTRWFQFAHFISQRDGHTLDENIKLFFSLANASLDTSIACWACKRTYDSAYPLTAIRSLFRDKQVHAWAGPEKGLRWFNGQYWQPYQPVDALSPAYPEYCSEQSAFSAAAATILRNFTGHDTLGTDMTQPMHSSSIEHDQPSQPITLTWHTFAEAAEQAGIAGLYSGIHFPQSDLDGRALGNGVAQQVWLKAQNYINGH